MDNNKKNKIYYSDIKATLTDKIEISFVSRLENLLGNKKITKLELAEKSGVTAKTIREWFKNKSAPVKHREETMQALGETLDVGREYLECLSIDHFYTVEKSYGKGYEDIYCEREYSARTDLFPAKENHKLNKGEITIDELLTMRVKDEEANALLDKEYRPEFEAREFDYERNSYIEYVNNLPNVDCEIVKSYEHGYKTKRIYNSCIYIFDIYLETETSINIISSGSIKNISLNEFDNIMKNSCRYNQFMLQPTNISMPTYEDKSITIIKRKNDEGENIENISNSQGELKETIYKDNGELISIKYFKEEEKVEKLIKRSALSSSLYKPIKDERDININKDKLKD